MTLIRLTILGLTAVATLAGCGRIAKPIDVHTNYVSRDLVSPACLQRCDVTGPTTKTWYGSSKTDPDGRIQYRLWPGTETMAHPEDGSPPPEVDPKEASDFEFNCWRQCQGGVVAQATMGAEAVAPMTSETKPVAAPRPAPSSAASGAPPY